MTCTCGGSFGSPFGPDGELCQVCHERIVKKLLVEDDLAEALGGVVEQLELFNSRGKPN